MKCPFCGFNDSRVIDSREVGETIRRRRLCPGCHSRYTTYERVIAKNLFIVKKDGRREEFQRGKILVGIRKACEKRPFPVGAVEKMVDEIEGELYKLGKREIPSKTIGDMVMQRLEELDYIAYIRFASVYRPFSDLESLKKAVDRLVRIKRRKQQPPLIQEAELNISKQSEGNNLKSLF